MISDTGPTDQGVQPRFYLFDALGNTRLLLKTTGATYQTAYWQPWGTTAFYPDTGLERQIWCYRDSETGLHYRQQRYYAPNLGRFISRDPIGFDGDINLYGYADGDPVNSTDPDGLSPDDDAPDADVTSSARFVNRRRRNFLRDSFGWNNQYWLEQQEDIRQNLGDRYTIKTGRSPIPVLMTVYEQAHLSGIASAARPMQAAAAANRATRCKTAEAYGKGKLGEELAGIVKNTERIPSALRSGRYRVPDVFNRARRIIGEVKNVKYLPYTKHIRDYEAIAARDGLIFELRVWWGTTLSPRLEEAIRAGRIVRIWY